MEGSFGFCSSPHQLVFGLWEETRVAGEISHTHGEKVQTLHRKARPEIRTLNLLANLCTPVPPVYPPKMTILMGTFEFLGHLAAVSSYFELHYSSVTKSGSNK